jgi:hypothetical protein
MLLQPGQVHSPEPSFLDDLAGGRLGIAVVPPPHLMLTEQGPSWARLSDRESDISWTYAFHQLRLDLGADQWARLRVDAERQARLLFASMARTQPPRTADPEWTPLVELERFELPDGAGLTVLHRTHYEPGFETVTGHTLIPAAAGLFEARWVTRARQTGGRESVLTLQSRLDGGPPVPGQAYLDDPSFDSRFPEHPLTTARAASSWWRGGRVVLTAPAPIPHRGEIHLPSVHCAVTPPPRFMLSRVVSSDWGECCYFDRVSFSGFEGIDRLAISRNNEWLGISGATGALAPHGEQHARHLLRGHTDVTCSSMVAPPRLPDGRPRDPAVMVLAEGTDSERVRTRLAWHWSIDSTGQVWSLGILSNAAVPVAELLRDLDMTRTSLRQ